MELIKIEKYLPDSARKPNHKCAVSMEKMVRVLAESNDGKLERFEVPTPGTALLFVVGDMARQAVMREFKRLESVVVSEIPAFVVEQARNKKAQERADKTRIRHVKTATA